MPNRQQRRSGDLPEMAFRITLANTPRGSETYEVHVEDLSALDEADFGRAMAQAIGARQTFFQAFENVSTIMVAGFVWLVRRRAEKNLQLNDVLKEVHVRDLQSFVSLNDDDDDEAEEESAVADPTNPEA
jgi:hypothetical protein